MFSQSNVGLGIYTLPEAGRLVGANVVTIRRWLLGYRFPTKGKGVSESKPIFQPQLPVLEGHLAIGFLDLIELLFIKAFRKHGVTLPTIRRAAKEAAKRWKTDHPFCVKRFATDGRDIFSTIDVVAGEDALLELARSQYAFKNILNPFLKHMDFGALGIDRWWPLGKSRFVCIDPRVAFGKPVVTPAFVPTETIYAAVRANQSNAEVAKWFDLSVSAVRAAVAFERNLAA